MAKAAVYNKEGEKVGDINLPAEVFGVAWNSDLVHQVVTSQMANARVPYAHTKDRSEVRGGGKKPWKQKGTGRARHGSIRSPLWRGGGVTFGPRKERNYTKKINRKMRTKALFSVLSKKLKDNEIMFVEDLSFAKPKTKEAKQTLDLLAKVKGYELLATKKRNAAVVATASKQDVIEKSFRNMGNIRVVEVRNLNPVVALSAKYLVIEKARDSVAALAQRAKREVKTEETKK